MNDRDDGESAKSVARQESTEQASHPARIRAARAGAGEPNLRGSSVVVTLPRASEAPMLTDRTTPVPVGALKRKEAARYLSVSPVSVHQLIRHGLIKPNRQLRHILIPIAELDRFFKDG